MQMSCSDLFFNSISDYEAPTMHLWFLLSPPKTTSNCLGLIRDSPFARCTLHRVNKYYMVCCSEVCAACRMFQGQQQNRGCTLTTLLLETTDNFTALVHTTTKLKVRD